jgi:predicted O-linked N-acetylglucosamine transferase (SPINDLY family)
MADTIWDRAQREAAAGRLDSALSMVRLHIKMRPKDLDAINLLGTLLQEAGRADEAIVQYQRLIAMAPDRPAYRHNYANSLLDAKRPREAIAQWEQLLSAHPDYLLGWIALSVAYLEIDDTPRAIEAGRRAVAMAPDLAPAAGNLGFALGRAGELEEAVEVLQRGVDANPTEHRLRSSLLMLLNYSTRPQAEILAAHRRYGDMFGAPREPARTPRDPERALRVGILSGDLSDHSVAFFLLPVLQHAHAGITLEAFSNGIPKPDDARAKQLRGLFGAWHECASMSPEGLDAAIRDRAIDVLLELSAHTESGRLPALASKPAPVIISAIGYPNTTGLPAVDWRVVDSITDPPGSEHLCTERLLRLDPCFLCYSPPQEAPEPALPADDAPITFGSFNNAAKIGPTSIDLWARVLKAVPGSRLLLKSQTLSDAAGRARIERRFVEAGIEASRLELVAYSKTRQEHLELYRRVHVALDTTPYNGTTTTCEALWMGVPVITTLGDRHAARVSASLLHACGHPELVAKDAEAFVQLASTLAQDRARLATLRASLRGELRASPLCDAPAYAARFHAAIRDCWKQWCARQAG